MAISQQDIERIAKKAANDIGRIYFSPCSVQIDNETFEGKECNSTGDTYYHHTSIRNLPSIRADGALRPSADPLKDGTVNFSLNPNLHRFGSVRLLFDRNKVEEINTKGMCYTTDHDKQSAIIDKIYEERAAKGEFTAPWRIEHEVGLERSGYRNECKRYTTKPVPLKYMKAVEYWIPWKPRMNIVGCNAYPQVALWTSWETELADPLKHVQEEIKQTREFAQELGVPFKVRTCYPYATLNDNKVLIFDNENLSRLEKGEEPIIRSRWETPLPEEKCLCPPEEIPEEV